MSLTFGRRGTRGVALAISAALAVSLGVSAPAHAAPTPKSAAAASSKGAATGLTEAQASAQARATGKPVAVTANTTATRTVQANANGTFTETDANQPVRAKIGGAWQNLDATLTRNADGTLSPKVADSTLRLSGGGKGPLAVMSHSATSLTLSLPAGITSLPTPSVSGDTATYPSVLPGVDLQITATDLGGFSEVLIVHNATAAANPALASLSFPATGKGVTLSTDAAGDFNAATSSGNVLYNAPAATMWDSATSSTITARAVTAKNNITGQTEKIDPRSGDPVYSSADGAGAGAHHASLKAHYADGRITLTPDASILHGKGSVFPIYIDPSYGSNNPEQSWTYIRDDFPSQSYWDTNDSENNTYGDLRVGYSYNDETGGYFNAESYFAMGINEGTLKGAKIWSSTLYTEEEWSYSCTASEVDLYQSGAISKSTTWNSPASFNTKLGSKNLANEYGNSSCSPNTYGWDVTSEIQTAVSGGWSNITYGLKTPDQNTSSEWHRFNTKVTQTTTYDHAPNTPTSLHTSPTTQCSSSDTVGLGDVTFYAGVSDPDNQTVYAFFKIWNTSTGAVLGSTSYLPFTSGTTASYTIAKNTFTNAITIKTKYSWDVYLTDGPSSDSDKLTSGTSATCNFYYDPTTEGAPTVTPTASSFQVGDASTFTFTKGTCPSGASCSTPASYTYQQDGATPINVTATSGSATVSIKPTRQTFTLTVYAVTSGGNVGLAATPIYNATAAANATDQDLTGDSVPDLLTVGATDLGHRSITDPTNSAHTESGYFPGANTSASLPAGLWLDGGTGASGQVGTTAGDIGLDGTGLTAAYGPTNFTGDQAITGRFTDNGFQDVLAYSPAQGQGVLINGSGDGSILDTAESGNIHNVDAITLADANNDSPIQIANAYQSVNATAYDDLVGVSGDDTNGYSLEYYETGDGDRAFSGGYVLTTDSTGSTAIAPPTSTASPNTWNTWEIFSTEVGTSTDLILWQPSTGLLYDWADFTASDNGDLLTATATYNSEELSSGFHAGKTFAGFEAAATPAGQLMVWTVDTTGAITTDVFTNLSTTATATDTTEPAQSMATSSHYWPLNDYTTTGKTAADVNTGASLNLTGGGDVAPYTADEQFKTDVILDGTSGTDLYTTKAIDLTNSFTVSLWAKPTAYGHMALSQDGTLYPGLMIYPTQSGWDFYLAKDNGAASWDGDSITAGTAQLGTWAHIEATFDKTTKVMELYVDDTLVATGSHTAPTTGASGDFRLGSNIDNGTQTSWYTGQLAQVQTWGGVALADEQPYTLAGYHQAITPERILDTRQTATNSYSQIKETDTPLAGYATLAVPIAGDTVTPVDGGTLTKIPSSVTAVAIDITLASESSNGNLTAYADGAEQPLTSSTNYMPSTTVTGYQIVPVSADGEIALYNYSSGTTHVIVDMTGYFTSDPTLAGDQTYHPLSPAYRDFDTAAATTNTSLTATGPVAAGATFTDSVVGVDGIPATATAVAMNLTAFGESGGGFLEAYPTGSTQPSALTNLTYQTNDVASLDADIPLGTGGKITVANEGTSSTNIIGDISGYYTTDTSGLAYHTVNPTRLVDTRYGIGGSATALASAGTYTVSAATTAQVTTQAGPTLAIMLTATDQTAAGDLVSYPDGTGKPGTSNLNWTSTAAIANANLALTPEGSDGAIDVTNNSTGTTDLIVDTSGYFANDARYAANHAWPLTDGVGKTAAADTVGSAPLTLNGTYSWTTSTIGDNPLQNVLGLDGSTATATTAAPAVDTATGFSVSAWVNLSSLSNTATIAAQEGTDNSGFYLWYNTGWKGFAFSFANADSTTYTWNAAGSSTTPTTGTWYHVVGTYDPAIETAKLYVNGALAATGTGIAAWNATGSFILGASKTGGTVGNYFPGDLSNVETYNYPLSATQVADLYQRTS